MRRLVAETQLSKDDLIWPMFVREGNNDETQVPSMPGVSRLTIDRIVAQAERAANLGIPAVCLFPYTETELKTEEDKNEEQED